jgi:glucose-6-phosphate 1-epimerase
MTEPMTPMSAEAPGVRITACPRGAHLMTWTTEGVERLWMSPLSGCGDAAAIRGGVPVLFPQFGTFGTLAKHGFARTADWTAVPPSGRPGRAELAFELPDSVATRAIWPHPFRARLEVSASARELEVSLTVANLGSTAATFTGGLHTYLAVTDPDAWIEGLAGAHAWDGMSTSQPRFTQPLGQRVPALATQDLVIQGAQDPVVLHDATLGRMSVIGEGFPNRIVWNPGPDSGLPDVAPGDEARFVCIEPTAVTPLDLLGGASWTGRQRLVLG